MSVIKPLQRRILRPVKKSLLVGSGAVVSPYLDGVINSVCCDLDATIEASYGGTGTTWSNLIATPSDGAAQTDYDVLQGNGANTTTYPTFTGSAGDSAAYWALDGGDYFSLKTGVNTAFLNGLHKTTGGTAWWATIAFRFASTGFQCVFGTMTGVLGEGVEILVTSAVAGVRVNIDRNGVRTNNDFSTGGLVAGTDYVLIISGDPTSSDDLKVWLNTVTSLTDADASTDSSSANASTILRMGARSDLGLPFKSGTRFYSFAMGSEYLDDAKAAAIIAHLETRHNRDYTP